jgi:hypothetical protein
MPRKSYAARTGQNARGASLLAAAMFQKIESVEDDNGNVLRVWKASEVNSFTNAHLRAVLENRVAVEANEMLGTVPPSAIKYCVTKGYIVPTGQSGTLFLVTFKVALELGMTMKFKGKFGGRKIPFAGKVA